MPTIKLRITNTIIMELIDVLKSSFVLTGYVFLISVIVGNISSAQMVGDLDPNAGSTCLSLNYNLKYRSRDISTSGEVSDLQDFLSDKGYLLDSNRGYFGAKTLAAVKAFQSANSLIASGYVGPITRTKISSISCSNPSLNTVSLSSLSNVNNLTTTSQSKDLDAFRSSLSNVVQYNANGAFITSSIAPLADNKKASLWYLNIKCPMSVSLKSKDIELCNTNTKYLSSDYYNIVNGITLVTASASNSSTKDSATINFVLSAYGDGGTKALGQSIGDVILQPVAKAVSVAPEIFSVGNTMIRSSDNFLTLGGNGLVSISGAEFLKDNNVVLAIAKKDITLTTVSGSYNGNGFMINTQNMLNKLPAGKYQFRLFTSDGKYSNSIGVWVVSDKYNIGVYKNDALYTTLQNDTSTDLQNVFVSSDKLSIKPLQISPDNYDLLYIRCDILNFVILPSFCNTSFSHMYQDSTIEIVPDTDAVVRGSMTISYERQSSAIISKLLLPVFSKFTVRVYTNDGGWRVEKHYSLN